MARPEFDPTADLASVADRALSLAMGPTLVLWSPDESWEVPTAGHPVHHHRDRPSPDTYATVASIGQLASSEDLPEMLGELKKKLGPEGILLFCEPTIAQQEPSKGPPHDITTSLWRNGLTVIECHRMRSRHGWRSYEYCWGRARLTPDGVPDRRWAT